MSNLSSFNSDEESPDEGTGGVQLPDMGLNSMENVRYASSFTSLRSHLVDPDIVPTTSNHSGRRFDEMMAEASGYHHNRNRPPIHSGPMASGPLPNGLTNARPVEFSEHPVYIGYAQQPHHGTHEISVPRGRSGRELLDQLYASNNGPPTHLSTQVRN